MQVYYICITQVYNSYITCLPIKLRERGWVAAGGVLPTLLLYGWSFQILVQLSNSIKTTKLLNFFILYMYYLCSEKYVKSGILLSILVVFFDIFQRHICRDIINRGKKLYHFLTPLPFFYKIHLLYILPMILTPKISFILSPYQWWKIGTRK